MTTAAEFRAALGPKLVAAEANLGITAVIPVTPVPDTIFAVKHDYGPRLGVIIEQARLQGRTNALASVMADILSWSTQLGLAHD